MSYIKILLIMVAILLCFGYMAFRQLLWKLEASRLTYFAARLSAEKSYDKGRLIKLELVVNNNHKPPHDKPYHFDGPNVVFDKTCYTDLLCKFTKSPNILVSEEFVRVYNERMNEIVSDPNMYELINREDANYWQQILLSKPPSKPNNDSNNE
jgi:hypothetical protein